jgi:mannose-1-phosphate guanylyltransferase/phosphomannomutase
MDRERLTITLDKNVLKLVDKFIDGSKIRNRSHAIEFLLNKSLVAKISQAVILAGGKGLNMRPFTYEMPKGLFPVGGKPILEYIIELLKKYEVRDIIISLGHLGNKIREHFQDGKKFGVKITYVQEENEQGTAGALLLAKKHINSDAFLVLHGDILTDMNLSDLISFHNDTNRLMTIALTSVLDPSSFGEVILHGTKIKKFIEKPRKGSHISQLVNSGIYVVDKEIFKLLPAQTPSFLEDLFGGLAKEGRLSGFIFAGKWVDIANPATYEKAIKQWSIS